MEQPNWWLLFVTALIPLIVGFLWYNPMTFEPAWMREAGLTREEVDSGSPLKKFGFAYLFGILGSFILSGLVVHQSGIAQLFFGDPALSEAGSTMSTLVNEFMTTYGDRHRSFGHGVIHGLESGLCLGLMMIGTNALFENKSWKYIFINLGYWMVSMALMGGVLCAYF